MNFNKAWQRSVALEERAVRTLSTCLIPRVTILKIAEEYDRLAHRALTHMPEERVPK